MEVCGHLYFAGKRMRAAMHRMPFAAAAMNPARIYAAHPAPAPLLLLLLLPLAESMEYLLRAMFSDVPRRQHHRSSPRNAAAAAGGTAGVADGDEPDASAGAEGGEAAAGDAAGEVVKCVPEKRALHVEVVLKRLRMPPAALAAAINHLKTDALKVCAEGVDVCCVPARTFQHA
jgi:hypothetical protein